MRIVAAILKLRKRPGLGYAVAVLSSLLALWVRISLAGIFEGYPFLTFFLAVLMSALIGGLGPGLFAGGLCWLGADKARRIPIHSH